MKKFYFLIAQCFFRDISKAVQAVFIAIVIFPMTVFGQLPTEFQKVELLTGLKNSVNMEFAPDGRIFILDRYGEVLIYKPATQTTVSAGVLNVFHELEDGLLGIAFDPQFQSNNYIYLHYSPASVTANRVSRFQMNGDQIVKSSEKILLEWPTQRECCYHAAGDMDFDSQGNLYIATGDNTNHSQYATLDETNPNNSSENTSSNTNDLRGKILRIKPQADGTYTIPSGNLFPNGAGGRAEIYVMGARNPYKIFVDKTNTDWLFWGEVGPDADFASNMGPEGLDEINLTKSAGNFGWPYFSGKNKPYLNTYADPDFYYDPANPVNISKWNTGARDLPPAKSSWLEFLHECYLAGPKYYFNSSINNPKKLPSVFDNSFFYYDFNLSKVWVVKMDDSGAILSTEQMAPKVVRGAGFIDLKIGPDGQLYILEYGDGCCPSNTGTGKLVRIDFVGTDTNLTPEVSISADKTSGSLPLTVNFSSEGTTDPNGDPLTYEWDFQSDGIVDSNAENPSFTYTQKGTFNALLRVNDGRGGVNSKSITIYAGNNAATFEFVYPPDGGMINWEDHIDYHIVVNDLEDGSTADGTIDCSKLNLVPSFGHLNHFHDGRAINQCKGTYYLDPTGHDTEGQDDIFFVFNVNYTDTHGSTSFDRISVHPKRMEAEFYDAANNANLITNTDALGGGSHIVRASSHNAYIVLSGRNLLNINAVSYRVASAIGGTIEIRTGSPTGNLISTVQVPVTGSVNNWVNVEAPVTNPGGKHDLYFVFKRNSGDVNLFDVNYIEFKGSGVSTDNTPPKISLLKTLSPNQISVKFNEALDKASAQNVANYAINNSISISSASLQADKRTVFLTTSALSVGVNYRLTVSNVKNESGVAINPSIFKDFVFENVLLRLNTGGNEFLHNGDVWKQDQYNSGGTKYANIVPISNTTLDEIYQTERNGAFTYNIPVPKSGFYDIALHFAEIHFGVNNSKGVGARVFNVNVENGQFSLTNYDIIAKAGAPATAIIEKFKGIEVKDGSLTVTFTAVVDKPKISGLEVFYGAGPTSNPSCPDTQFPSQWNEVVIGSEVPYRSVYMFSQDIDGDGYKDIITGGWWYKNPGTPNGTWVQKVIGAPMNNMSLVHDFDKDGDFDIFGTQGKYISAEMAWAENDGKGNFTIHTNIPAGTSTYPETFMAGAAIGNFNNVANTQIAITWNGADVQGYESSVQMLTVPADPVNQAWTIKSISPDSKGEAISAGDIDKDGDLDLFQGLIWLRNDNGTWTTFSTKLTLPSRMDRNALVDIDKNGSLDGIVTQVGTDQTVNWFQPPTDPTQGWTSKTIGSDIDGGLSLDVVDIDFDGDKDVIIGEWKNAYRLLAFENDLCNTGTWIQHTLHPGGGTMDHHDGAQTVDLDNDGDLDIISIGWSKRIPRVYVNGDSGGSTNQAPVVDAGSNKSLTLPTNSTSLTATASDADGTVTAYAWQQVSGPSQATLTNAATATVTVSELVAGTYTFKVTVTDDDGATGSDQVDVTVNEGSSGGGEGSDVWLEAECATVLGSSWTTGSSTEASNGSYLLVKQGNNSTSVAPSGSEAIASFSFSASVAGTYKLYTRTLALSGGDNSFYIRINGGSWSVWNLTVASTFTWNNFSSSGIALNAGTNTIELAYREDGVQVDKFFLTQSTTTPSGTGATASNCGSTARIVNAAQKGADNSSFVKEGGIEQWSGINNIISLFPNPFEDRIEISFKNPVNIQALSFSVINNLGVEMPLVNSQVLMNGNTAVLDLADLTLSSGTYTLKITNTDHNQIMMKRIVKID